MSPFVYATAVYAMNLARLVREMSYRTTPARHGFEIEGVNDAVLRRFSKRAHERDKIVSEMSKKLSRKLSQQRGGVCGPSKSDQKLKGISTAEVRERQLAQLSSEESGSLRSLVTPAQTNPTMPVLECEQEALTHAMAHIFERQSVAGA